MHAMVISHKKNKGVGAALQSALQFVRNSNIDIMVNIDSDGQFNPNDIEKLIKPIIADEADFVTASRFVDSNYYPQMPKVKFFGNLIMSKLISKLTNQKFLDVSCGFRAYNRESILRLNIFGDFTYTQEMFIDLAFKKMRILEVPIHVKGVRESGKSKVANNLFIYGYSTIKIIIKSLRDFKPFALFGYLASSAFILGLIQSSILFFHYFKYQSFSPYKWLGFSGAFFILLGFLLLLIGFILDMFGRMRMNQEELIYELRKKN